MKPYGRMNKNASIELTPLNTCTRILSIIPTQQSLNFSLTHTHFQVKSATPLLDTVYIRLNLNLTVNGSGPPRCCPHNYSFRHWNVNNESNTRTHAREHGDQYFSIKNEPYIRFFRIRSAKELSAGVYPEILYLCLVLNPFFMNGMYISAIEADWDLVGE